MSVRWGIIGTGNIAHKFAEDFSEVHNGTLTAVSSRSEERAEKFAAEFSVPHNFDSVEEMLQSGVCDAVYIATPHTAHQRDSLFCLKHNTHVLCEKPAAVNATQLEEVQKAHKDSGLFYMEAYWTVFLPVIQKVIQWIHEDRIGKVNLIYANFGFNPPFDPKGRLFNLQLAGGALLDVGIYPCMFGNIIYDAAPQKISASAVIGSTGVDELTQFQLDYGDNRVLQGAASITHELDSRAVIYGKGGRIEIDDFWKSCRAKLITETGTDTFEDERKTTGYNFETEAVSRLISEGKTEHSIMTLDRSLRNMKTMDEMRRQIGLTYPAD